MFNCLPTGLSLIIYSDFRFQDQDQDQFHRTLTASARCVQILCLGRLLAPKAASIYPTIVGYNLPPAKDKTARKLSRNK